MLPGVTDRSCWILLQQLLAIGDSERALQLLNAQIEVTDEVLLDPQETGVRYILQQLALLIKSIPRYSQITWACFEDFQLARSQWVTSVTMLSDELPVRSHVALKHRACLERPPTVLHPGVLTRRSHQAFSLFISSLSSRLT